MISSQETASPVSPNSAPLEIKIASPRMAHPPTELEQLKNEFDQLTCISNNQPLWLKLKLANQIDNENKKLIVLQKIYDKLCKEYQIEEEKKQEIKNKEKNQYLRKGLFFFLILADITLMSVNGYLGMIQVLTLAIPKITSLATKLVSIVASAIEGVMLYSVLKPLLQRGVGISPKPKPALLTEVQGKRIALTKKINHLMTHNFSQIAPNGSHTYQTYVEMMNSCNEDVQKIKLPHLKETFLKKGARYFLSGLNTALSLTGAYFSAVLVITAISSALIGTPAGWAIIVAAILAQVVSKYAVRQATVYDLLNSSSQQHNIIQKELQDFKDPKNEFDKNLGYMRLLTPIEKKSEEKVTKETRKDSSFSSTETLKISQASSRYSFQHHNKLTSSFSLSKDTTSVKTLRCC